MYIVGFVRCKAIILDDKANNATQSVDVMP